MIKMQNCWANNMTTSIQVSSNYGPNNPELSTNISSFGRMFVDESSLDISILPVS